MKPSRLQVSALILALVNITLLSLQLAGIRVWFPVIAMSAGASGALLVPTVKQRRKRKPRLSAVRAQYCPHCWEPVLLFEHLCWRCTGRLDIQAVVTTWKPDIWDVLTHPGAAHQSW